jgi:glutathione peroxidase
VVLGFPCNQFGKQEPGTDAEIKAFAQSKYNVTFPMFSKIDVNGANALPLFNYLKFDPSVGTKDIKWNFEKFLVNKQGKVVERGGTPKKPFEFEEAIVALLNE